MTWHEVGFQCRYATRFIGVRVRGLKPTATGLRRYATGRLMQLLSTGRMRPVW